MPKSKDLNEALELLYGGEVLNFTPEGYQGAIGHLRLIDRALARRVERSLAPILKKRIFSGRQREWYETSEGTRTRLALLPDNPHFLADVRTAREVLLIPPGHIHITEEHVIWKDLQSFMKPENIRRVVEGNVVAEWLDVHRSVSSGQAIMEKDRSMLSPDMRESAILSAGVDTQKIEVPEWLSRTNAEPGHEKNIVSPVDWAAGRLVERYSLPGHTLFAITMFLLTQNHSLFNRIEPLRIVVTHMDSSRDPKAFNISIKGMDEFITKEDWERVWTNFVKPRQDSLWEERGMSPQGRRTIDIRRLKKAMTFYQKMVDAKSDFKNFYHSNEGGGDKATLEIEIENLRKTIHDLENILKPKD